jgi:5'-nucleotidase
MSGQLIMRNKNKHEIIISQAAWNGLMIGKTVFSFDNGKQKLNIDARYLMPGQPCGQKFAASFEGLRLIKEQSVSA